MTLASIARAFAPAPSLQPEVLHEPRVHSVTELRVPWAGAITGAAVAQVAFDGEQPVGVPLVEV